MQEYILYKKNQVNSGAIFSKPKKIIFELCIDKYRINTFEITQYKLNKYRIKKYGINKHG